MKIYILLIFFIVLSQNTFSQTIDENERHLSAVLDTLDNSYFWQSIPEDGWGRIPPEGYWLKYPFRVKLIELLSDIDKTLEKPMSVDYLLTLFDLKHKRKIAANYNKIADKIIAFRSDSANLKLWNIATTKISDKQEYLDYQLKIHVLNEFIRFEILKDKTRDYILLNKDFNINYFGYFDKEIDFKIIDGQIAYFQAEMSKPDINTSRDAGYIFIENGISPKKNCSIRLSDWYLSKYYYKKVEKGEKLTYADFDWDNFNDKKNIELTIRFLKAIKENYDEIIQVCKTKIE